MAGSGAAAGMALGVYEWRSGGPLSVPPGDVGGELVEPRARGVGDGGQRQRVARLGDEPRDVGLDPVERTGAGEHLLERVHVVGGETRIAEPAQQLTIGRAGA